MKNEPKNPPFPFSKTALLIVSEPTTVVWNCGPNAHGQDIKVTRYKQDGQTLFRIDREAANQRDDFVWIGGLTAQNLREIAEVLTTQPK